MSDQQERKGTKFVFATVGARTERGAVNRYRVRAGSIVLASGVTDSPGRTKRIPTDAAEPLCLEIAAL